jgi:hypothetical protein
MSYIDEADTDKMRKMAHLVETIGRLRALLETDPYNNFAASLINQYSRGKRLTDKQLWAAERMLDRKAEKPKDAVEIDLTPIRTMFETAVGNGYKRPKYRAEGLVITRAPDTGRNPGALYVTQEEGDTAAGEAPDTYQGKIFGVEFQPARTIAETTLSALYKIAENPLDAALRYGQRTGRCACCGRLLTNHKSIDLGIGPICKARWGL